MNHAFKFAITSAAAAWMIVSAGGTVAKAADEADTTRPTAQAKPDPLPFRWFFEFGNDVSSDKALADILKHVDMAAEHGFNGMVWEGNFVGMDQWPKANLERLAKLKEHCDARKVEVIPLMMTAGYDGGITAVNQNLLEGLAAKDMLFEVKGGLATCAGEDRPLSVEDGGFETAKGDAAAGFIAQANPGKVSFVDRNVFKEGKASLRFENPSGKRASVTLPPLTKPYKYYALRFWAKAENLKPATISVCIYQDGFQTNRVDFKPTDKWQQFDCTVFTQDAKETQVHVGQLERQDRQVLDRRHRTL